MGIKGRMVALLFAIILMGTASILPKFYLSLVPVAEVIQPVQISNTPYISCSGTLMLKHIQEVYAAQPLMIEEVYVSEGDWVEEGQLLAKVDLATSKSLVGTNTQQNVQIDPSEINNYLTLAQQYGIEAELKEYLDNQNISTALESSSQYQQITNIMAPVSGRLMFFSAESGRLLSDGEPILTISSEDCNKAVLQVDESDISNVELSDKVILAGPGLGERIYHGIVTHISPVAVQTFQGLNQRAAVNVDIEIFDPDFMLRPGLSVKAKIITGESSTKLSVPYESVAQDAQNREYVYLLEDGILQKRYIKIDQELTDCVQVANGLEENQAVLYEAENFKDTLKYRIIQKGNWYE